MLETAHRNVRYALRTLTRAPGFAITVVLTLALAIGANSAFFSAIDAVLLRPLPLPDANRLMRLTQIRDGVTETYIAPVRLEDWNRLNSTFEALTGYSAEDVSDTTGDVAEVVRRARVMPRFLDVWGVAPALGRGFTDDEYRSGGPRAMLISDRYWRRRFGADPDVLNSIIRIGERSYSVAGVMPPSFWFPERDVDLWEPEPLDAPFRQSRELVWHNGVGRLRPGVTTEQAQADLILVQAQLGEQYPETDAAIGVRAVPLKESVVGGVRSSLWLLFGAVSVLLLIACTNITALLLARAAAREEELAVRVSLGASRAAVVVQVLTESAVLVFTGAALGLLTAAAANGGMHLLAPAVPRLEEAAIDARMLAYTLTAAVAVTLLCGLLPAVRSVRGLGPLSRSSRTLLSPRHSLQWLLVGTQVALSVALLAGAGLLLRSAEALSRVDLGFDPAHVLALRVSATFSEPGGIDARARRIERLVEELQALPGIEAAAASPLLPAGAQFPAEFALAEARADAEPRMIAEMRAVTPGYFATLGIPIQAGELCRLDTGSEVMVNRSFADRYLAGRSAVGLHVVGEVYASSTGRIVGVVGDAREIRPDRDPGPVVYFCFSAGTASPWFLVRTSGEPTTAIAGIRAQLNELEPLRAVYDVAPLEARIGDAYSQNRVRMILLILFASTALGLACLGVYGTLSYVVSLRRREVGLRIAVGAARRNIVAQFVRRALGVVGAGIVAGIVLSLALGRVLSGMLFGVSPSDPATLGGVALLVIVVATLAAALPALRASRIDPMQTLRQE